MEAIRLNKVVRMVKSSWQGCPVRRDSMWRWSC